jgi:hypothetical protein
MKHTLYNVAGFTFKAVILLILLAFFSVGMYFALVRPAIRNLTQVQPLTVDGTAKKDIAPDLAIVSVGAVFTNTDPAVLKKEADKALSDSTTAILAIGIPQEKIKSNYSISPKYDKDGQNITGYTTSVTLEVDVKDFTKTDQILEIAQQNKLSVVYGVTFTLEDPIAAKEQLRTAAIDAAKAKAEAWSEETGISLGKVINISEGGYYPYYNNDLLRANTLVAPSAGTQSSSGSTTISPGQTEIEMTVNLTYEVN